MGFRKPIETDMVVSELRHAWVELNNPYNDGFTGWELKRELYEIKWLLDRILKESSNFGEIEQRYLDEIEKNKIMQELKK